jgi:hypothetical protein
LEANRRNRRLPVTFVFGRKRLVISLISDQSDRTFDRYPMAYAATDRELEKLNRLGVGTVERVGHDVQRIMHGAGWVR